MGHQQQQQHDINSSTNENTTTDNNYFFRSDLLANCENSNNTITTNQQHQQQTFLNKNNGSNNTNNNANYDDINNGNAVTAAPSILVPALTTTITSERRCRHPSGRAGRVVASHLPRDVLFPTRHRAPPSQDYKTVVATLSAAGHHVHLKGGSGARGGGATSAVVPGQAGEEGGYFGGGLFGLGRLDQQQQQQQKMLICGGLDNSNNVKNNINGKTRLFAAATAARAALSSTTLGTAAGIRQQQQSPYKLLPHHNHHHHQQQLSQRVRTTMAGGSNFIFNYSNFNNKLGVFQALPHAMTRTKGTAGFPTFFDDYPSKKSPPVTISRCCADGANGNMFAAAGDGVDKRRTTTMEAAELHSSDRQQYNCFGADAASPLQAPAPHQTMAKKTMAVPAATPQAKAIHTGNNKCCTAVATDSVSPADAYGPQIQMFLPQTNCNNKNSDKNCLINNIKNRNNRHKNNGNGNNTAAVVNASTSTTTTKPTTNTGHDGHYCRCGWECQTPQDENREDDGFGDAEDEEEDLVFPIEI